MEMLQIRGLNFLRRIAVRKLVVKVSLVAKLREGWEI